MTSTSGSSTRSIDALARHGCYLAGDGANSVRGNHVCQVLGVVVFLGVNLLDTVVWKNLSKNGKTVYMILAIRADKDGVSYPSTMRLAKDAGVSRPTVISGIKNCLENGAIKIRRTTGSPNAYLVKDLTGGCKGALQGGCKAPLHKQVFNIKARKAKSITAPNALAEHVTPGRYTNSCPEKIGDVLQRMYGGGFGVN